MRSAGAATIRDWLNTQFGGVRTTDQWEDLWNAATNVDFLVGETTSDLALMQLLATNDQIEIALRRLSAYIYEHRTGDKSGARSMLAVAAPGGATDVAPTWLIRDATEHSKCEHQRSERRTNAWSRSTSFPRGAAMQHNTDQLAWKVARALSERA